MVVLNACHLRLLHLQISKLSMEFLKVPFWVHFFIYVNDLPLCLDTTPRLFADNTALLITGKDCDNMESLANLELSKAGVGNLFLTQPRSTFQ